MIPGVRFTTALLGLWMAFAHPALGAESSDSAQARPFIRGGAFDKPYLHSLQGRARFGGYVESFFRFERASGITEEVTFELERINLFAFAPVGDRVRMASELEFEEGGEEVKIELAIVDLELAPHLILRGGMLLSPLGRFNQAHDGPANELNDRPLVSTEIIGTTLSEPGMGFLGTIPLGRSARMTYETYLVNGFHDGIINASAGTRIPLGRGNFEDNNNHPSFVGRLAFSPVTEFELGGSLHTGPYNEYRVDGLNVDSRRDLTLAVLDGTVAWKRLSAEGEFAWAAIDVPPGTGGVFASRQQGYYFQAAYRIASGLFPAWSSSTLSAATRFEFVDFDSDVEGSSIRRLTLGLRFLPVSETALKLNYRYIWNRDSFNTASSEAGLVFGIATYF